jgi:hypothetical protein
MIYMLEYKSREYMKTQRKDVCDWNSTYISYYRTFYKISYVRYPKAII